LPLINFEFHYTFGETGTQPFVGNLLEDFFRFDLAQQIGVRQSLGGYGIVAAGALYTGIPTKVWKDPFVVGFSREETSRYSNGFRVAYDKIFGSGLQLQNTYRKIELRSERSGDFLDLPFLERQLLDREGDDHHGLVL
jgi:hypothetical protein